MEKKKVEQDPIVAELEAIKRLLVLYLLKAGTPQGEIAKALKASQGSISKSYRFGKVKPLGSD